MTIRYIIVERGRPGHPEVPKKYYPSIRATGRVTDHELAVEASEMCTLSTADVVAVIEVFLKLIPEHLSEGEIVELGALGNFWLRFSAEGVDRPEHVRGSLIKKLIPRFMPGKRFKQVLTDARFKKLR